MTHINTSQFNNLEIPLLTKSYRLYQLLYKYLKDFPKRERYSLGEKAELILLEIIELTVYINGLPKGLREPQLLRLNSKIELAKILVRLAYDLKLLGTNQYLILQDYLQEIGKMTGGWIKAERNR